jgi:peptidyl-prolyl isomerase G (cyclophilin G)
MVQGGDITAGDGTGGVSIFGPEFDDENLEWRSLDAPGLVCMANRGPDTNNSQFFITLADSSHLDGKHTVFGHLVSGQQVLDAMTQVPVDDNDRPKLPVIISNCGELERRKKNPIAHPSLKGSTTEETPGTSPARGRRKRRHSSSPTPSRSPSPSRGHGRRSASRHRHNHRHRRQRSDAAPRSRSHSRAVESTSDSHTPPIQDARRRSDLSADHTLRGRPRRAEPNEQGGRKRSPPPSRPRSKETGYRRQRSLPNQYRRYERQHNHGEDDEEEQQLRRQEYERDGGDRGRENHGRLGGGDGRLGGYDDEEMENNSGGIVYKGRGAMKYREQKRW